MYPVFGIGLVLLQASRMAGAQSLIAFEFPLKILIGCVAILPPGTHTKPARCTQGPIAIYTRASTVPLFEHSDAHALWQRFNRLDLLTIAKYRPAHATRTAPQHLIRLC